MSNKSVTAGRSGREIARQAERQGAIVDKVGSFLSILNANGERAYVKDSNRTLTKPEREKIIKVLLAIGFNVLVGAACWLWYVPQLALGM